VCSRSSDLWVIAEALDVIFDVFAEDHLDGICQKISLVEKLSHLLPLLKGKVSFTLNIYFLKYILITITKNSLFDKLVNPIVACFIRLCLVNRQIFRQLVSFYSYVLF